MAASERGTSVSVAMLLVRCIFPAVLVCTVAANANAAPVREDCPCRLARGATPVGPTPEKPSVPSTSSVFALATTPGAGFLVSSEAGPMRPDVPPITAGRVVGESFAALGTAAVGGVISAAVGYGLVWNCNTGECTTVGVGTAFVLYSTLIAAAVDGAGSAGDEDVPFSSVFIGAIAGTAVGLPTFIYAANHGSVDAQATMLFSVLLPPTGAVIGAIAGRRWDATPIGSLRLLSAPPASSAWNTATAPGPLPGTRIPVASLTF